MMQRLFKNRGRASAVFLFSSMLLATACGNKSGNEEQSGSIDTSDIYTLELRKDRLEKDKYLLSNPDTPIKASDIALFSKLDYFPPDKRFAIAVVLQREKQPEEIVMATSKNKPRQMLRIGHFAFSIGGQDCTLQVYAPKDTSDGNYWFIPFADLTNGETTYDAGRYIDIENPDSDSTFLDFNYAYNPYCAYNERYDCPIPPPANALPVAITAGEKKFPLKHAH